MKSAIIMSSQLHQHNRWDVGFHLLYDEYADRAQALSAVLSEEAAVALLSDETVPAEALALLAPLTRVTQGTPKREQLLSAARAYPFIALALLKDKAPALLERRQAQAQRALERIAQTRLTLEEAGPTIEGLLPIPFDVRNLLASNHFVGAVVYFDGQTLSIPVETSKTAYVADCWVVELSDWTGADYVAARVDEGEVPVPRRCEDLGKPVGFLKDLADHTSNYGMGWRR